MTTEEDIQRENTASFILAKPVTIVVRRKIRTPDGAGGIVTADAPPSYPQTMRLLRGTTGTFSPLSRAEEGTVEQPNFTLLGLWDADLRRDDLFDLEGVTYRVDSVTRNEYETKGVVIRA